MRGHEPKTESAPTRLDTRNEWLPEAVAALERDGAVVLMETGLATAAEVTGEQMLQDVQSLLPHARALTVYAQGHLRQYPRTGTDSRFAEILGNPVLQLVAATVLGPDFYVGNYMGHTVLPGSQNQPVHADWGPLWPDYRHYHPPALLAFNLALVPTDTTNGGIEIWPGTHRIVDGFTPGTLTVSEKACSLRPAAAPPTQVVMDPGDLLIRDVRTWHRGTRNTSARIRPIVFGVLAAGWYRYRTTRPLVISSELAARVNGLGVEVMCEFSNAKFDPVRWSLDSDE